MVNIIQIFGIIFIIFATSRLYLRYKDKSLTASAALVWGVLWVLVSYFLIFPSSSSSLALSLGIGRGADLIVYVSIVVVYYLLFKIYVKIEQMNEDVTKLVRSIALEKKK